MNKWKETEEVVALIEKVICPSSRVETNVYLPDLNSTSEKKRQCDVVIRNGFPPRETISIVEVQHRKSKADVGNFDGWYQKMRDVGAQHLICVSKSGFPDSILEKAIRIGPTIRLMTFDALESQSWPINFLSNVVKNPRRELIKVSSAKIDYKNDSDTEPEDVRIVEGDKCFKYNGIQLTAKDLFFRYIDYLEGVGKEFGDGEHTIKVILPLDEDELMFRLGHANREITKLSAEIQVAIKNRQYSLACSEYKQIEYNEGLAWLMECNVYKEDKEVMLKLIVTPSSDGTYHLVARIIA